MNAARPSKVWVWLNYALKLEDAVVVAVAIVAAYLNASKPASALAVSFHFMHRTLWRSAPSFLPSFAPALSYLPLLCSRLQPSARTGQRQVKSSLNPKSGSLARSLARALLVPIRNMAFQLEPQLISANEWRSARPSAPARPRPPECPPLPPASTCSSSRTLCTSRISA